MKSDAPLRLVLYEPEYKAQWDEFVRHSKNGVFLFYRDYMEYHADRFSDFSLLFYQDDELVAVMPANRVDETVVSHGGLTFGGIISDARMTTSLMLEVFSVLLNSLRARGSKRLIYKAIPHIYHVLPAEEDLYALFVHSAHLYRRDISSTVVAGPRLPLAENRRRAFKRAQCHGLTVQRSEDFAGFMAIVDASLQARHKVHPVHTAAEMELLASRFPQNIKLFAALHEGEMLGGVIIYESERVAHSQYPHATQEGLKLGALDFINNMLVNDVYKEKPYVDFGISTLDNGYTLTLGLIRNKESYGARATVYDFYELNLEM